MNIRLRIQADGQSRDFAHSGATVTIGRNPAASIVLEENSPSSVVSWDHGDAAQCQQGCAGIVRHRRAGDHCSSGSLSASA